MIFTANFRPRDPWYLRAAAKPVLMCDLRTGPSDRPRLMEFGFSNGPGTSLDQLVFGYGLNGTLGAAVANGITFVPDVEGYDPGGLAIGLEWTSLPTAPVNYHRRFGPSTSNNFCQQVVLRFPQGLVIPPSNSYGFYLIGLVAGAAGALAPLEMWATVDI